MGDIAGIATISRAEHCAQQGRPILDSTALADAIDAELVEPADESGPARAAESPESEMRYPETGDDGDDDTAGKHMMRQGQPLPDQQRSRDQSVRTASSASRWSRRSWCRCRWSSSR